MSEQKDIPLEIKVISILRNHLELAVSEITDLLKQIAQETPIEPTTVEGGKVEHVDYGGKLYARMIQTEGRLSILPVESLQIKASDATITNFLKPRILDKIREKHGFDYSIEESDGLLRAIIIRGALDAKTVEELKSPIGWALEKASEREEQTPGRGAVVEVRQYFPKDLEELLSFEDLGDWIKISPRQYLGSENFAKISSIVREHGGEYVSAGKESHFRIPKETKQDG